MKTLEHLDDIDFAKALAEHMSVALDRDLVAESYKKLAMAIANNVVKNALYRSAGVQLS